MCCYSCDCLCLLSFLRLHGPYLSIAFLVAVPRSGDRRPHLWGDPNPSFWNSPLAVSSLLCPLGSSLLASVGEPHDHRSPHHSPKDSIFVGHPFSHAGPDTHRYWSFLFNLKQFLIHIHFFIWYIFSLLGLFSRLISSYLHVFSHLRNVCVTENTQCLFFRSLIYFAERNDLFLSIFCQITCFSSIWLNRTPLCI